MSFSLDTLTEGIKARNVGQGNRRLLEKWGRTGLLRGMEGVHRENMATLLENQAGQALRESSSLGGGTPASSDIRGFTNIAFPIVRRVFGSLIANELVSIQPMSLPSGLLFYLDYTYGTTLGGNGSKVQNAYDGDQNSIYGQPVNPGKNGAASAVGGQYDLAGSGYSRARKKNVGTASNATLNTLAIGNVFKPGLAATDGETAANLKLTTAHAAFYSHDPQIESLIEGGTGFTLMAIPKSCFPDIDVSLLREVTVFEATALNPVALIDPGTAVQAGDGCLNVRRLNRLVKSWDATELTPEFASASDYTHILMVVAQGAGDITAADLNGDGAAQHLAVEYVQAAGTNEDDLSTIVSPAFESGFPVGSDSDIPEIDIKIESVSVVAQTRKLRAKWSPELAQDLNAYHSLDAEVELTQILSEQVALEIDREILGDLLNQAGAANFFWSRSPGNFVNKRTGAAISRASSLRPGPAFTGTVREWYETLVETIIDVSNEIHRKTLRGAGNFIVVSPEVATVMEASVLYKPALSLDSDGQVASPMVLGAEKVGTLSSRFTVYKDPYFPRHKILVGFKGSSYLETGYVYAPYVPLIVTPTIFAPEDFTPRKGVMTRYGKKMVRSDFYGTVTCLDMNII